MRASALIVVGAVGLVAVGCDTRAPEEPRESSESLLSLREGEGALRMDSGFLEVRFQGSWRGVCDDSFDRVDAEVACKQLGGELLEYQTGVSGSGEFWLDDLNCSGDERALALCGHSGFGNHNCGSSEHVTVSCLGPAGSTGKLRMDSGFLEIQHNGEWRGVCDDSFDRTDAEVVCRQLEGELLDFQTGVSGSGAFWLDDVGCSGDEEFLASCSHSGFGNHNCSSSEHVTVSCLGPSSSTGKLRMDSGFLEIQHNGEWRGICDDSFDRTDAEVACRQMEGELLDFQTGVSGSGAFWLDDVGCSGDEEFLASCSHSGFGNHNCSSGEHVSISCLGPTGSTGKLRMDSGFLEIQHNGEWRGVCDDSFDRTDAEVVCKQLDGELLDFQTGVSGSGAFWLDDLGCSGDEEFLASCSHSGFGNHNCSSSEHVTVSCLGSGSSTGKLRMDSGFLEIQHNGQWRGVCDDSFDRTDAEVVCRQLNGELLEYQTGVSGSGEFWLDDVGCSGDEEFLASCSHSGFGNHNCGSSEHVIVACLGPF